MKHSKQEILTFIEKFKYIYGIEKEQYKNNLEYIFTNGNCYFFALILKEIFPKSHIVYSQIDCHFLIMYDYHLYDILGDRTNDFSAYYLVDWENYENEDKSEYKRIIRDCILLQTR